MRSRSAAVLAGVIVLAGGAGGCGSRPLPAGSASGERRLGFTAGAFADEREFEARYAAAISKPHLSAAHRALTFRPHPAGSEGGRVVADSVRAALDRAGLDVEVTEYLAYLSSPGDVRVELVAPVRATLSLEEPADPRDPDTAHPELGPGYIAYSASADVTAPVVYVNYGLPPDYARLREAGIDVRGRIALARYGRSHRAVKVRTAEEAGAVGVILYSDPADDGAARGAVWPEGMWRASHLLQRGNAKYSWFWHGDPLTPGVAATAGAAALDPAEAPTLPHIPVVALSSDEAQRILRVVEGPVAPEGFQGGLPFEYHVGPGPATVRLAVEMRDGRRPIRNVIGRLEGATEPDRWVILGTHHDAWTFGGVDPGSGAAVILEVARGLAALSRTGWRPARSILFAFWDAEEYGLIGSTEFAEDHERELQERTVCYINTDMYTDGRFVAGGVPSLRDFMIEVARDIPEGEARLYDAWLASEWSRQPSERRRQGIEGFEVELNALGSGADFVAFQDYVGLPALSLEFLFEGGWGFGAYHSNYDTRFIVERLADPGFERGARLARVLGVTAMRLASAPVLPFRPSHYATRIRAFVEAAEGWAVSGEGQRGAPVDTRGLQALADTLVVRAAELERRIDDVLDAGRVPAGARRVNDLLMRLEQTLLDHGELADRRWYRHVIYGWNIHSLYDGQPLPDLAQAIRVGEATGIAREQDRIRRALHRMLAGIEEALSALPEDAGPEGAEPEASSASPRD